MNKLKYAIVFTILFKLKKKFKNNAINETIISPNIDLYIISLVLCSLLKLNLKLSPIK